MEFDQLKTVIAGILSLDPNEITEEETFVEDLGADSLDLFQIVMGIEEVFQIKIPPQEARRSQRSVKLWLWFIRWWK